MKRMRVSDNHHYDVMRWPHLDGWRALHVVHIPDAGNPQVVNLDASGECGNEPVHATEADAMRACELHFSVYSWPVYTKWSEVD